MTKRAVDQDITLALASVLPLANQNFMMLGVAAAQLFSGDRKRKH